MTRTLNMAQAAVFAARISLSASRRIEPPVIERAAGDGAGELCRARLEQRLDVVDRGEPARGDHRNRDRLGQRDGGVEIEALEHAVARDVGVDDGGDAGVLEAARDVERRQLRGLRPALDRHLAVARVEPDRDLAGKSRAACLTNGGSRTAAVPMMTRLTPFSSQPSTVAMSRMPPPSCTGMPTLSRMRSTAAAFTGLPAKAPSRSTMCRYSKPCCSKARACAAGSRWNTVARAMSPCSRRTARPSFRSMAGNRITAPTSKNSRSASSPAAGSSPGETACRPCCRGRRWP